MTSTGLGQVTVEDFMTTFTPRLRRVSRVMDGSEQYVDQTVADVRGAIASTHNGGGASKDLERTAWRTACTSFLAREHLPKGLLPPPSDQDSPATRLKQALSALPARKRLAIALAHQEGLTVHELAAALSSTADDAEVLLTAAEGHLIALVRARGDELELPERVHAGEKAPHPRRGS